MCKKAWVQEVAIVQNHRVEIQATKIYLKITAPVSGKLIEKVRSIKNAKWFLHSFILTIVSFRCWVPCK